MTLPTEEQVREALKTVIDPELHIDIVNLGLIYGIERNEEESKIHLQMTFTSPACPVGPQLKETVENVVAGLEGVKDARVEITFSPPWDPRVNCSDEAKDLLGIF